MPLTYLMLVKNILERLKIWYLIHPYFLDGRYCKKNPWAKFTNKTNLLSLHSYHHNSYIRFILFDSLRVSDISLLKLISVKMGFSNQILVWNRYHLQKLFTKFIYKQKTADKLEKKTHIWYKYFSVYLLQIIRLSCMYQAVCQT